MAQQVKPTRDARLPSVLQVDAGWRSDKGAVRETNEDSAIIVVPSDPDTLDEKGVLALIADGMGGHEGGEIASSTVVEMVPEFYYGDERFTEGRLVQAVEEANRAIYERGRADRMLAGMGTTCTALVLRQGLAYAAHVGDSRIYLVRAGSAYRMTEDHSATMQLVNKGLLTLAEASRHEDRNVILRAVGTQEKVDVETWRSPFPVRNGDAFLLCSDGLHEALSDDEIANYCSSMESVERTCEAMIGEALARQCSDNVSVAILRVLGGTRQ